MDFVDIPRITDRTSQVNETIGTVSHYTTFYLTAIIKKKSVKEMYATQQFTLSNTSYMVISDINLHRFIHFFFFSFGFRSGSFLLQEN
jgi:hypothetical protein